MEMSIAQREEARDTSGYFLAGHHVQPGVYREMQTGREVQMDEPGILPATCDGHVAVYIRRHTAWAQKDHSLQERF